MTWLVEYLNIKGTDLFTHHTIMQWQRYTTFLCNSNDRKHGINLKTSLKSYSRLKFNQWYETVKISRNTEKSRDNTSHCRFVGTIMAQIRILLLCELSLKITGLHASSSTHTYMDTNVRSINSCGNFGVSVFTPANKIWRCKKMRSIPTSLLKQNALVHDWPDHTFELVYRMSKGIILSSTA